MAIIYGIIANGSVLNLSDKVNNDIILMEGNTIIAPSNPLSEWHLLNKMGSLGDYYMKDEEYTIDELRDAVGANTIIDCLIRKESSWRVDVSGDSGRAYGLLQFHQPTFDMFAKKYNLNLDIKRPIDQIVLAKLMLNDNINYIRHWSVWPKCYAM